jgi:hypothetical protein
VPAPPPGPVQLRRWCGRLTRQAGEQAADLVTGQRDQPLIIRVAAGGLAGQDGLRCTITNCRWSVSRYDVTITADRDGGYLSNPRGCTTFQAEPITPGRTHHRRASEHPLGLRMTVRNSRTKLTNMDGILADACSEDAAPLALESNELRRHHRASPRGLHVVSTWSPRGLHVVSTLARLMLNSLTYAI